MKALTLLGATFFLTILVFLIFDSAELKGQESISVFIMFLFPTYFVNRFVFSVVEEKGFFEWYDTDMNDVLFIAFSIGIILSIITFFVAEGSFAPILIASYFGFPVFSGFAFCVIVFVLGFEGGGSRTSKNRTVKISDASDPLEIGKKYKVKIKEG